MRVSQQRGVRKPNGQISSIAQRAHRPDYVLILLVGLLMLFGLMIIYAIGPQRAQLLNTVSGGAFSDSYFFVKQALSLILALVTLGVMAFMPLQIIRQYAGKILLIGLAACGLLFIFGNIFHVEQIARCTLGACRWFELGPIGSIQPSELLKFGLLIFLARFLAEQMKRDNVNNWDDTILPVVIVSGIALFIVVVLQKDLGTGVAMISLISSILLVSGINLHYGSLLVAGVLVMGVLAIVSAPHRIERVMTFIGGAGSSTAATVDDNESYHINQAKIAIGSGGLTGLGIGNSIQATGYLPEAINDSVFAIIAETFGFVGSILLLVLLSILLLRILRIADLLQDEWMRLLAAGVFGWLAAHVVLNIASMTGVFPLTGITLPLLSVGGTSMVFIAAALGMVFQASRYTVHGSLIRKGPYADSMRGRRIGGSRNPGRRSTV